MDEHKQIMLIATIVMTQERYADLDPDYLKDAVKHGPVLAKCWQGEEKTEGQKRKKPLKLGA